MILSNVAFLAIRDEAYEEAAELLDEALEAARAGGADAHRIAQIRGNQGLVALFTGRHGAAGRAFRDELEHGREGRFRNVLPEGLLGLAGVAAAAGEQGRAARLAVPPKPAPQPPSSPSTSWCSSACASVSSCPRAPRSGTRAGDGRSVPGRHSARARQ
jgi:hypothetical protein